MSFGPSGSTSVTWARIVASSEPGSTTRTRSGRIVAVRPAAGSVPLEDLAAIADGEAPLADVQGAVGVARWEEVVQHRADEAGDERVRGPLVEILRRAVLLELTEIHDRDPVGHAHRLDLVVRHVHHRLADLVLDALELGAHVRAKRRVEVREGLVEQEDRRLHDHRASERDLLEVVHRQASGRAIERGGQPDGLGDGFDATVDLRLVGPLAARLRLEAEREVLVHGHVREDRVVLEDEADVALADRDLRHRPLVEEHLAGGRRLEPRDHVHRGRLATARGPEQRGERSVRNLEVEVVDGVQRPEVLGEAAEGDRRHR